MKTLGLDPLIHDSARVQDCTFGRYCEVMRDARLLDVEMGDYSYCAEGADIFCTTIEKFSNIAAATRINPGNHPMWRATQHHMVYRAAMYWDDAEDEPEFFQWRRQHRVHIGHDTWLGHGAIILPGRSVGIGAIVGAGAVVTKDVDPYQIVAGNPARVIRPRFDPGIADRLQALAWWDWDHLALRAALDDFRTLSVEAFLEKYGA